MKRTFIAIPSLGITDIRFALSLAGLSKPKGTSIACSPRAMPDVARNALFDQAVKFKYDYVFFLDDDMVVDPMLLDALTGFLEEYPSVAAVAPLAFRRHPPFQPCVGTLKEGRMIPLEELDGDPIDVDVIHFAATLVRTDALKKVDPPRFEFSKNGDALTGEDIILSGKLKALGGDLVCVRDFVADHIGIPPLIGKNARKIALASATEPAKSIIAQP